MTEWTALVREAHLYASSVQEREYAAQTQGVDDVLTLFLLTQNARSASKFFKILTNFAKAALYLKYLLCVRYRYVSCITHLLTTCRAIQIFQILWMRYQCN